MSTHQRIASYWDDIQGTRHNYAVLAEGLHRLFKEKSRKKILDIGCGTGSLLIHLASLGYDCTGIDIDEDMLDRARQKTSEKGLDICFINGDMKDIRLREQFDAVTCFQAICLLESHEAVRATFQGIRRLLLPRGLFLFDVLKRPDAPPPDQSPTAEARSRGPFMDIALEKENLKILRLNTVTMKPGKMEWAAAYFFEEAGKLSLDLQTTPLTLYTPREIRELLEESGFHIQDLHILAAGGIKLENIEIRAMLNT